LALTITRSVVLWKIFIISTFEISPSSASTEFGPSVFPSSA